MTVPTSLIGRISALAAMERMKNPPDLDWTEINDGRHHLGMERSFTHTSAFVGPKEGGKGACPSRKHKHERLPSEVSAYLSIKVIVHGKKSRQWSEQKERLTVLAGSNGHRCTRNPASTRTCVSLAHLGHGLYSVQHFLPVLLNLAPPQNTFI